GAGGSAAAGGGRGDGVDEQGRGPAGCAGRRGGWVGAVTLGADERGSLPARLDEQAKGARLTRARGRDGGRGGDRHRADRRTTRPARAPRHGSGQRVREPTRPPTARPDRPV